MERLVQSKRRPRELGRHWPLEVRISLVCGSLFSEAGPQYKAVLRYEDIRGDVRTKTGRFPSIRAARAWGRRQLQLTNRV